MGLIREIRDVIGEDNTVNIGVWDDELAVYVTEKEIPISVILHEVGFEVFLDVEGYSWKLNHEQIRIIDRVMEVITKNIDEIIRDTRRSVK